MEAGHPEQLEKYVACELKAYHQSIFHNVDPRDRLCELEESMDSMTGDLRLLEESMHDFRSQFEGEQTMLEKQEETLAGHLCKLETYLATFTEVQTSRWSVLGVHEEDLARPLADLRASLVSDLRSLHEYC